MKTGVEKQEQEISMPECPNLSDVQPAIPGVPPPAGGEPAPGAESTPKGGTAPGGEPAPGEHAPSRRR